MQLNTMHTLHYRRQYLMVVTPVPPVRGLDKGRIKDKWILLHKD